MITLSANTIQFSFFLICPFPLSLPLHSPCLSLIYVPVVCRAPGSLLAAPRVPISSQSDNPFASPTRPNPLLIVPLCLPTLNFPSSLPLLAFPFTYQAALSFPSMARQSIPLPLIFFLLFPINIPHSCTSLSILTFPPAITIRPGFLPSPLSPEANSLQPPLPYFTRGFLMRGVTL